MGLVLGKRERKGVTRSLYIHRYKVPGGRACAACRPPPCARPRRRRAASGRPPGSAPRAAPPSPRPRPGPVVCLFWGGGLLVVVFVGVWGCWGCWGVVGGGVGGGGGGPVLLVLGWCVVGFCGGVEVVTARSAESIAHPSTDRPPDPARHAIKSIRPTQSTPTPHCTHARTSHHPPSWCLKPRACCPCPCPCSSKPVAPALLIPPPRLPSGGGGCSSRRRLRRSILASLQAAHRSACV